MDLLRRDPVGDHEVTSARLHGPNEDPYDYDYEYSEAELRELAGKLQGQREGRNEVYCTFNDVGMYEDATALLELL